MSTTTTERRSRGRPLGSKQQALSSWVSGGGRFTLGQVARAHGWSIRQASDTVARAESRGLVQRVGQTHQPGCKRPVVQFAPARQSEPAPAQLLGQALQGWTR